MNDSCAVRRIALDTISCSSAEVSVHCADSRVMPRHATGTDSKLSAGGGVSVGGFAMAFTAGALDAVDAGRLGVGVGLAWTPCSRHSRVSRNDGGGGMWSKLAVPGDGTEPPAELGAGESYPAYRGAVSSVEVGLKARGRPDLEVCRRLMVRGPLGRGRGDVGKRTGSIEAKFGGQVQGFERGTMEWA